MEYKVQNLLTDMKLFRNGSVVVLKKGTESRVSAEEYQYLSQVYGMSLKGNRAIEVRTTQPVKIETIAQEPQKKRKRKKS